MIQSATKPTKTVIPASELSRSTMRNASCIQRKYNNTASHELKAEITWEHAASVMTRLASGAASYAQWTLATATRLG